MTATVCETGAHAGSGGPGSGGQPPGAPLSLDLTGLKCPVPLLRTKKQLAGLAGGALIEVTATDPHSRDDFMRFCDGTTCSVLRIDERDAKFVFLIRKEGAAS